MHRYHVTHLSAAQHIEELVCILLQHRLLGRELGQGDREQLPRVEEAALLSEGEHPVGQNLEALELLEVLAHLLLGLERFW